MLQTSRVLDLNDREVRAKLLAPFTDRLDVHALGPAADFTPAPL